MPTAPAPFAALDPAAFDAARYRADFPALRGEVHGRPLVYLDNAATTQKPQAVIDRLVAYYARENANIHRGVHKLSQDATEAYEAARARIARFIGAAHAHEVVFVRGTTEAVNLVAATYGRTHVGPGDEVVVTALEHHSNLVPWQLLCAERGARLVVAPINDAGELDLDAYRALLTERTKLVSVVHLSNALGTLLPVERMIADAHAHGVPVFVDGAQAAAHVALDVAALGADFYAFSSHKALGPTGVGVLYGREALLDAMPPYQGGGDMIETVSYERATWNALPHKFEAGTPHIAGVAGLAAALDYLDGIGLDRIAAYEHDLLAYATEKVAALGDVRLVGTAARKASVLSFLLGGLHPYDVGTILDQLGVAVRTGHHCAQPLMGRLGIPGTVRASFAFYNTGADVDALVAALGKARAMLS